MSRRAGPRPVQLGLRQNAAQFALLVAVNALVGGMVGQQQSTLPLLAERVFGLSGYAFIFAYVAAFGIAKVAANYLAGALADRFGRKPVLVAGWLFAVPVPLLVILAPSWGWVIAANLFLGVNQGLSWSTTVLMKIDIVGPRQRGLAIGVNEAAGYGAVAVTSLAAGLLAARYGLRPTPFLLGACYIVLALALCLLFVRETRGHALKEAAARPEPSGALPLRRIIAQVTWADASMSTASQVGLANNLNFGLSWGVFPLLFATAGLRIAQIALLVAIYPAVWGAGQLATGWLSDRWGRKPFIAAGIALQAAAMALIAATTGFPGWAAGTALLGIGTAMAYPVLLAVIGDVAHPAWRGRAVGIYRVWRDLGYVAGAIIGGAAADLFGLRWAVWAAAALSLAAAISATARLHETLPPADG